MSCCKPHIKVLDAIVAMDGVILQINKAFSSLDGNEPLCICIPRNIIIQNSLANSDAVQVFITDITSATNLPCFLGCSGNYLRFDQLRRFMRCHAHGCCCPSFTFNCFYGIDPQHFTFHHRMCASTFSPLPTVLTAAATSSAEVTTTV